MRTQGNTCSKHVACKNKLDVNMADGGRFYGRGGRSFGDSAWPIDPYYTPSPIPDPAISQTLDRVLALLETQGKDIESMRVDAATMKEEIEDLKQKSAESSSSSSSPHRTVKKLPTELSVSGTIIMVCECDSRTLSFCHRRLL